MTHPIPSPAPPDSSRRPPLRAPEGAFGVFAAGRRAADQQARQARGQARLSGARADRHQQPVRRARILRQGRAVGHPADRRREPRGRFRGDRAHGHRDRRAAGAAAGAARRNAGAPRDERGGLPQPAEDRQPRAHGHRRRRAAARQDQPRRRTRRGAHRADRRSGRTDRRRARRQSGPGRGGAPDYARADVRRPVVCRDPAPRHGARKAGRAAADRTRLRA